MHFTVHWCIAMHLLKNANLVLNRVNFMEKNYAISSNQCGDIIFLVDYNPMTHRSQKCNDCGSMHDDFRKKLGLHGASLPNKWKM